jgi:hypothetical protein
LICAVYAEKLSEKLEILLELDIFPLGDLKSAPEISSTSLGNLHSSLGNADS